MLKKKLGFVCIMLAAALLCSVPALAVGSSAPDAENITVTNNLTGTPDTVEVGNLAANDIVKVYNSAAATEPVGVTVAGGGSAAVYVSQLGTAAGSVYVTVTSTGCDESPRTTKAYSAEERSAAPSSDDISAQNNITGVLDTVTVSNTAVGDIVRAYESANGAAPVSTAESTGTSATLYINQLGTAAGTVYISLQSPNKLESARTKASYIKEASSTTLTQGNIVVTNNYASSDTVEVSGLTADDVVKVYSSSKGTEVLGSETASGTAVTITLPDGTLSASGGKVYVSVTSPGSNESARTAASYISEKSMSLSVGAVTVTNNYYREAGETQVLGTEDIVKISGVNAGNVVNIYKTPTGTEKWVDAITVSEENIDNGSVTAEIGQLGTAAGKIYVTITKSSQAESARTIVSYPAEPTTTAPPISNIAVTNSVADSDTVFVKGLASGDIVTVYSASKAGTVLGSETASGDSVTITLADDLGSAAGKVYITVKSEDKLESARTAASYAKEASSTTLSLGNIVVTNNYASSDTVEISGLTADDFVKIYSSSRGTEVLGSETASDETLTITLLDGRLSPSGGKVYVSVTSPGSNESTRTAASYASEKSTSLSSASVTVTNNYYREAGGTQVSGTEDIVRISGVETGNVINIYKASTGTDRWVDAITVSEENIDNGSVTAEIGQLGTSAGKIYVTITKSSQAESKRTTVSYPKEPTTAALPASAITVTNNFNAEDTVVITGLAGGETVYIYSTSMSKSPIATTEVSGDTVAITLNDGILSSGNGRVYVSVKEEDKLESARTSQAYTSEVSEAPALSHILVVNNPGEADDTVTITGLTDGDTVTIYDLSTGGNVLAEETADGKSLTITLADKLPDAAGRIYVTVRSINKAESKRVSVSYLAA